MAKFRKKPVMVEAWQVNPNIGSMPDWLLDKLGRGVSTNGGLTPFFIDTLEGRMLAFDGDWIIKGVAGELYPCKPDIFAATYEPEGP